MRFLILIVISAVSGNSIKGGYSGLSENLLSSLTNLWNKDATSNKNEKRSIWTDILDDSGDLFSDEDNTLAQYKYAKPNPPPLPGSQESVLQQFAKKNKLHSAQPKVTYGRINPPGKSFKKGGDGPLYHAIYKSKPFTYEELLHYYDYLDESGEGKIDSKEVTDEQVPQTNRDPNCTQNIESMIDKFLKSLAVLAERPVVVQGNFCCKGHNNVELVKQESPDAGDNAPDIVGLEQPVPVATPMPEYIGQASPLDRYAGNQDLIVEVKKQYEGLLKLLNSTGSNQVGVGNSVSSTSASSGITPDTTPSNSDFATGEMPSDNLSTDSSQGPTATTTAGGNSSITESTKPILVGGTPGTAEMPTEAASGTPANGAPSETLIEGEASETPVNGEPSETMAEREPSETPAAAEPSKTPAKAEPSETPAEAKPSETPAEREPSETPADEAPSETPAEEVSIIPPSEAIPSDETPPEGEAKRKRRSIDNENPSESPLFTALGDPENVGQLLETTYGNITSSETYVLNPDPIVEHIHARLMARERKREQRYLEKHSELGIKPKCRKSSSSLNKVDPIESVELIANPPEFIESVENDGY